jgi:hypothetical protein
MSIAGLPRPIGYVLGGGGSLGAVQVGMLQALSEHDIAPGIVAAEVPVIYLHGPEPHPVSPLDFRQTNLLIETSYEAARAFLADLEVTGPGLYGSP